MSKFDKLIDNASIQFEDILVKMRACVLWSDLVPLSVSAHNLAMTMVSLYQAKTLEAEILNASSVCRGSTDPLELDGLNKALRDMVAKINADQVGQTQTQAHEEVNRIRASMGLDELPSEQYGSVAFGGESEIEAIMSLLDSKSIESEVDGESLTPYERVLRVLTQAEGKDIVRTRFVGDSMQYEAFKQAAQELKDAHDVLDGFNIPDFDADGKTPLRIRMQVHAMCEVDKVEDEHRKHVNSACAERGECERRHDATKSALAEVLVERGIANKEVAELVEYLNSLNVAREDIAGILPLKERARLIIKYYEAVAT